MQNLEAYRDENKERYAGPVLIGAGVLVLARGAFSKLRPPRSHLARRRSFLRRYVREMYRSPILAVSVSELYQLLSALCVSELDRLLSALCVSELDQLLSALCVSELDQLLSALCVTI